MTLTAKDVAEITRLLEESNFDELTLELEGLKLTLRRSGVAPAPGLPEGPPGPAPAQTAHGPADTHSHDASATGLAHVRAEGDRAPEPPGATQEVTAPLLGTFYRAPKPGAPPFIDIGAVVEEDTIIGIIEVMKLMNTVRAGVRGTVAQILAQDGALVEYGQALLSISKAVST